MKLAMALRGFFIEGAQSGAKAVLIREKTDKECLFTNHRED
jgi:hypothetical protein